MLWVRDKKIAVREIGNRSAIRWIKIKRFFSLMLIEILTFLFTCVSVLVPWNASICLFHTKGLAVIFFFLQLVRRMVDFTTCPPLVLIYITSSAESMNHFCFLLSAFCILLFHFDFHVITRIYLIFFHKRHEGTRVPLFHNSQFTVFCFS